MVLLQETETAFKSLHFIFFSFCPLSVTFLRVKIFIMLFLSVWLCEKEKERKKRGREKRTHRKKCEVCLVKKNEQEAWIVRWGDGGQWIGQKVEGCLWTPVYFLSLPSRPEKSGKDLPQTSKGEALGGGGSSHIHTLKRIHIKTTNMLTRFNGL